jgi:hypothetical protein
MRLVGPLIAKAAPALITQDPFKMLLGGSATRDPRLADWGGFARTPFGGSAAAASRPRPRRPPAKPGRRAMPQRAARRYS